MGLFLDHLERRVMLDAGFAPGTNYAVGVGPRDVAVADVNGDGNLDIVAALYDSSQIAVRLGTGDGTFAGASTFSVSDSPNGLTIGDVNRDGKLDVVTANYWTDKVSVLIGSGTGTFVEQYTIDVGDKPRSVALGDVNGDGKLDLVVANSGDDTVSVLTGSGTGSFGGATTYATDRFPWSVKLADVDADGALDILAANAAGDNVSVLLGGGDGTFATHTAYTAGDGIYDLAVGDVNSDGALDVVTADHLTTNVSVLMGGGSGAFAAPVTFAVGAQPWSVELADFDADGHLDIVTANGWDNNMTVLLGAGDGAFEAQNTLVLGEPPMGIAIGDVNGDGALDVVTANNYDDNVTVLLHESTSFDGTFSPPTDYDVATDPASIVAADVNGDGKMDAIVANRGSNNVSVLLGGGDGTLGPHQTFSTGAQPVSVAVADVNGDGKLDIIAADSAGDTVSVLLGAGDGTFASATFLVAGSSPSGVAVGDVNRDGKLDVVSASSGSNDVSVILGTGDAFSDQTLFAVGNAPSSVALADLNADGKLDIITCNAGGNSVSVLIGDGMGTFGAPGNYAVGAGPAWLALGDVNVDGFPDIVTANEADDTVSVLIGAGDGTFGVQSSFGTDSGPRWVALADTNRDGKLDIITANAGTNNVSVLLGMGNVDFAAQEKYAAGGAPAGFAIGDFKRDGILDIVVANSASDNVSVLRGRQFIGFKLDEASDTGLSSKDYITSDNTPTFNAKVYEGGTIELDWNGDGTTDNTYIIPSGGTYQYSPTSALADGVHNITVTYTDPTSHVSTKSKETTIDTTAPDTPGSPDLRADDDSGVSSADDVTRETALVLDITSTENYYRLFREGVQISGDYASGTSWSVDAEVEGTWTYSIEAVDAAGNVSGRSSDLAVTVDTTAPDTPGAPDLQPGSDSGISQYDDITKLTTIVFDVAGTDAYFRFYRNDVSIGGDYETGATYAATGQTGGDWRYTVQAVDAAGNASQRSDALALAIDTTAPVRPSAADLLSSSDTGESTSDDVTQDTTPSLAVSGFETYYRLMRGFDIVSGAWETSGTYIDGPLADGIVSYVVYSLDVAGNLSVGSPALAVAIDTAGPTVESTTPSGEVSRKPTQIQVVFTDANALWVATVIDGGNYTLLSSGGDGVFDNANDVDLPALLGAVSYTSATKTAVIPVTGDLTDETYRLTIRGTSTVRDAAGNALGDGVDHSAVFSVAIPPAAGPIIGSLGVSPDPVTQGQDLTLTAHSVIDPNDDAIVRVDFYRDINDNGQLETGVDQLLGFDTTAGDGWTWIASTAGFPTDANRFFARAQDEGALWGDAVAATATVNPAGNQAPTVGSLSDSPDPVALGGDLTLRAGSAADADGAVTTIQFWRDSNADGTLDLDTDQLLGTDTDGGDGWTWTGATTGFPAGSNRYFARARDDVGAWSARVETTGIVNASNQSPTIGGVTAAPGVVTQGEDVTLTASGASDADGAIIQVAFYRDSNNNGTLDVGTDALLGSDATPGDGSVWTGSTAAFPTGANRFFARAQDNEGAWSAAVETTATVSQANQVPTIDSLTSTPGVVTQGHDLTLTANNVTDGDGSVAETEFYRDSNNNGTLDVGTDALLGSDTTPGDGSVWTGSTAAFPGGANRFFARAQDNEGAWSAAVETTATVLERTGGDTTPPSAGLQPAGGPVYGATTFQFSVRYDDETAVDASTIDHNDIMVVDPDGFNHAATLVTKTSTSDITTIFATYQMTAPGGAWEGDDEGTYEVTIQSGEVADTSGNEVPEITGGAFTVSFGDVDLTPPTASAQYVGSPIPGTDYFDFLIRYADNVAVDASDFDSSDILIVGPHGWMQVAAFAAASSDADADTIDATYRITAPGGTWDIDDDGVYRIEVRSNAVSDTSGLFVAEGEIGTFLMDMANIDDVAPTAMLLSVQDPVDGDATLTFVVRYADDTAVDASTLGVGDVLVTGPGDFSQIATFIQATSGDDTSPIDATYSVAAPGGTWEGGDDGTYAVTVQSDEVADNSGNPLHGGQLGTFDVGLTQIDVLGSWQKDDVTVTLVDVNGGADADPADVVVRFGPNGVVTSISLTGEASFDGVGLVISGATRLSSITDLRRGTIGTLAFIAANCQIGNVMLKGGMAGFNLNGKTMGGLTFLADIDGDGDTTDATALYSGGGLAMLMARGGGTIAGDVVAQGRLGMVLALGVTIAGDISSGASVGNVMGIAGGAITGSVRSAGSIGMVMSSGGIGSAGSEIRAATTVGNIMALGGDVRANIVAGSTSNRAVGMVMATQGNISGNIQSAGGVGNVMAIGGTVSGNITATAGSVAMVMAGSGITGNVRGTTVGMVMAIGGNVSGAVTATGASARAVGMVMAIRGSISGDIQSAGGVGNVMAIGGAVSGDITATGGSVAMVMAGSGVTGDVRGTTVGMVMAIGGNVSGAVTATSAATRAVGMVMATRGNISGDIQSAGGVGNVMAIGGTVGGNITSAGAIGMVMAGKGIGGDLHAITAGTSIGNIMALGGDIRSSITARGTGARAIGMVMAVQGSINESRIRSRGGLGMVMARDITDTKISAGTLTMVMARRDLARTLLSGGYDFGGDGEEGGDDDTLGSGSVGTVSAGRNLDRVTVVAGVGPGADGVLGTADDVRAGGNGKITSVIARGTITGCVFEAEDGTYAI